MRTSDERSKFLAILEDAPFISYAANKVGISRATIYRWQKDNAHFRERVNKVLQIGRSQLVDKAEMALFKKVSEGNMDAIKFCLRHNDPKYIEKRTIYIPPPEENKRLQPGEVCKECGHKGREPVSEERMQLIKNAFSNFGLLKKEEKNKNAENDKMNNDRSTDKKD